MVNCIYCGKKNKNILEKKQVPYGEEYFCKNKDCYEQFQKAYHESLEGEGFE